MVEVQHLPVVDVHGHPFLDRGSDHRRTVHRPDRLWRRIARSTWRRAASSSPATCGMNCSRVKQNTLYSRRMILDLAMFFGVRSRRSTRWSTARNNAVAAGYGHYVSRLYGDAGLETLSSTSACLCRSRRRSGKGRTSGRGRSGLPDRAVDRRPAENRYRLDRVQAAV